MRARAGVCAIRCDDDLMIGRAAEGASGLVGVGVVGANGHDFARFASFLVRKQSARCPGTFRTQARPAPARAPTPRLQWKLTLAVTVPPGTYTSQNSEPTAAEPTQALPNRRSTFLARREPLLVSPVGVAFSQGESLVAPGPMVPVRHYLTNKYLFPFASA